MNYDLVLEEAVLGMGGFVFFNCCRMSPNSMPLISVLILVMTLHLAYRHMLVVVTCSPVFMPTPILGLHTRIPTRVPFEMVTSKIGCLSADTGFGTTSLFFPSINISVISKYIFLFQNIFQKVCKNISKTFPFEGIRI